MNDDKLEKKVELLLLYAFEIGRNYEQIYLDLDLYNVINFNDLLIAKGKGSQIKTDNMNINNLEKIGKSKITTDIEFRKLKRLCELRKKLNSLMDFSC